MFTKVKAAVKSLRSRYSSETDTEKSNGQININLKSLKELNIINQQRTTTNEEDVTIILLTKNLKLLNNQSFIVSLQSINDYIKIFDNEEEDALRYIESINEEKVILIIDYVSNHLISILETLKQIEVIFLYTCESSIDLSSHMITICYTEDELLNKIKYIREQLNREIVSFSIYNQNRKEKYDLTHEAGLFLFFQLFKAAFKKLPKNPESKKLMLTKYREYYSQNFHILNELIDFENNYKSNQALKWYLNNSFIYRLINKALRTENITSLYYFHFFIGDLSKQLEKEFKKFDSKDILRVYRAFKITKIEIEKFQQNIGNLILTNGYLSTTRQRDIAYNYINKQDLQSNQEKILFEYVIDLVHVKSIIFADISQYNQTIESDDILFDIGTAFKINSCKYNEKENFWIINVSGTDEGVDVASEYIEYQQAKMKDSNIVLMLGHLLIEVGDYDKAEKYFHTILHSSVPNEEEIACIYYNIGRIYRLKGNYQDALEYLNRSYITHSQARPSRLLSAAKAMNAMGIVYTELNCIEQAINSFECTLKLYTKTIHEYHPDIGGTLINLGNIYSEQGDYEHALTYFQRTQKIYKYNLPSNHPNIAILLNNMGNLYYQQNKLDLALDAYQRALEINEKILPSNHLFIAKNRYNLSKIYILLGDQAKAQFQLKQASECAIFDPNSSVETIKSDPFLWDRNDMDNIFKLNIESNELISS